jgi:hypothetical protein
MNLGDECDVYWREIGQLETNCSSNDTSLHLWILGGAKRKTGDICDTFD